MESVVGETNEFGGKAHVRQFFQSALKGAALGAIIGGFALLILAGGQTDNAVMGAFIGALVGALFGMRAHTPSHLHSRQSHMAHHMRDASGVYFLGSTDPGQNPDAGNLDAGGFDGGGFDGGGG